MTNTKVGYESMDLMMFDEPTTLTEVNSASEVIVPNQSSSVEESNTPSGDSDVRFADRLKRVLDLFEEITLKLRNFRMSCQLIILFVVFGGLLNYSLGHMVPQGDRVGKPNATIRLAKLRQLNDYFQTPGDIATIESVSDLKTLSGYPAILEIISLTSVYLPEIELPKGGYRGTISHLRVSGSVTEDWLEFLLNFFTEISTVHLNINGLCKGSNVMDRNTLVPLSLPRVLNLSISDSNLCSIVNWVFKWQLPHVQKIHLKRVDFTRKSFKAFCAFLNGSQGTMKGDVGLEDCKLCEDCETTQIPPGVRINTM